jgi:alkanesulfonate monooxygenase SsuD/methylene tetrahydromethanopterin reductase-like flavin-dependent oxidoreductase (luciferase family)
MFPRLREQIGTALDLIVEFSTLGEYRLAVDGPGAAGAPADAPGQAPQLGGAGPQALRAAVRRTVAGGATGHVPVATPAARRSMRTAAARRGGSPRAPEQLCLAV